MTSPSPPAAPRHSYETTLCRERLERLLEVLERNGGKETLRQLDRIYAIRRFEVLEAERLGWVVIKSQKPRTGRPSTVVQLSKTPAAKLPPWRRCMQRPMSHRHWKFALLTTCASLHRGGSLSGLPCHIESYLKAYPAASSRNGAHASCSRLMNHPNVFAARQWLYATANGEIPRDLGKPQTPGEIWDALANYGNFRAEYRGYRRRLYRRA
jgi:hypothetical protein